MWTDVYAARRGDLAAFNRLVTAHQNQLYVLCFRALGQEQAAIEAVQAAVLQAQRHMHDCDHQAFHSWLLRWGVRACQERLRAAANAGASAGAPEAPAQDVQACLCQMPESQRLALILVDVVGLSYCEAAVVLESTSEQVSHRVAQARWQLQGLASAGAPAAH